MEVKNTGIDLVDIARIRAAIERRGDRFVSRILTGREMEETGYSRGPSGEDSGAGQRVVERIAARFAAKEAVAKAIGCGISGFSWTDVEILRRHGEPPRVELRRRALAVATEKGISRILVSMSHDRSYAVAQAIAQGG
ncbi:MAG: holo-ACP synthase [Ignavibacteriales bacterium]